MTYLFIGDRKRDPDIWGVGFVTFENITDAKDKIWQYVDGLGTEVALPVSRCRGD